MTKKVQEHERDERRFRFCAAMMRKATEGAADGVKENELCSHCKTRLATHRDAHGRPICLHCRLGGSEVLHTIRGGRQIGRNAKCPCGSNRKFKNCCGPGSDGK
jgi:uncharacterized protein YecA (UPF0149 family)